MKSCKDISPAVTRVADHVASAAARGRVDSHVGVCAQCRGQLTAEREARRVVREHASALIGHAPLDLRARCAAARTQAAPPVRRPMPMLNRTSWPMALAATLVLAVAGSAFYGLVINPSKAVAAQLAAEKSNYLETAYLILNGELPKKAQYDEWVDSITHHTFLHENLKDLMMGFGYDAHPMGMLVSMMGALSTFYPEAKNIHDPLVRQKQIHRLIAKIPTLAAFAYRHSKGLPYVYPDNDLSYSADFLQMMFKIGGRYDVSPVLERALDVLFILHADHEQNCSANAMRAVGSSQVDPYCATAAAAAALYGPLHGGANEGPLQLLMQ